MKLQFSMLLAIVLFVAGCSSKQRGLYVVSSDRGIALEPTLSRIVLIRGSRNTQQEMGNEQLLLAVIAYRPEFSSNSSSHQCESETNVTTVRQSHSGPSGTFSYSIKWDRTNEKVVFGSHEFRRTDGNVFVLVDDGSGKMPEYHQIPGIIDTESVAEILDFARQAIQGSALQDVLNRIHARAD